MESLIVTNEKQNLNPHYFYEKIEDIFDRRQICPARRLKRFLTSNDLRINGQRIFSRSQKLAIFHDEISLNGQKLILEPDLYLVMNKPAGYLCTTSTQNENARLVYELIDHSYNNYIEENKLTALHTIGRLDGNTEGLLIFTTNGNFSHQIALPENQVQKKYQVLLRDPVDEALQAKYINQCSRGIEIPPMWNSKGFASAPAKLEFLNEEVEAAPVTNKCVLQTNNLATANIMNSVDKTHLCHLTVTEGKFHEVKRIFLALGNEVVKLKRLSISNFSLPPELAIGEVREMGEGEILQVLETK